MINLHLAQSMAQADAGIPAIRIIAILLVLINAVAITMALLRAFDKLKHHPAANQWGHFFGRFIIYEVLGAATIVMALPFYWMVVTSFKDSATASSATPVWTPSRIQSMAPHPETGEMIPVVPLTAQVRPGQPVTVVPKESYRFRSVTADGVTITKRVPDEGTTFQVDPRLMTQQSILSLDLENYLTAWYRPEESSRGEVNFLTYFLVSIFTSLMATTGTLITSALAAFAFARLNFWGKGAFFYIVLATMMVPGQVLLIPNFLILSKLGMLDTYAALVVPWLASVFTIFLMRQFFMTIPEDLWDAARIDGSSRFRYLWQIVVPLSRPVFITAGIFDFLNNWNSLLWPLIVTSTPSKRTLMVGLQNLNDDAGAEFQILMAASCLAIVPVVIMFFFLQRFFIEGIARTGLK